MPRARRVPAGEPPATGLVAAMLDELGELYGMPVDAPGTPSATPADFAEPRGCFVVLEDEAGTVLAGGGLKPAGEETCEIKRMYVVPEARGRGVARALLAALEDEARRMGYARVRLDTGPKQEHARALYESAGYVEIDAYNENPFAAFWAEKRL